MNKKIVRWISIILLIVVVGGIIFAYNYNKKKTLDELKANVDGHLFDNGGTKIDELTSEFKEEYSLTSENDSSDEEVTLHTESAD